LVIVKVFAFVASIDPTYAPFAFEDENGVYHGYEVDVIHALEKKLNEKAKIENMEFPGALVGISTGKIDMIVTVDEADVKKEKVFLTQPIMECGVTVIANKENNKINSVDDIKGDATIGAIQGTLPAYVIGKWAEDGKIEDKQIKYFDNLPDMYESLRLNKIDTAINDSVVNEYYSNNSKKHSFKVVSDELESSPGLMAITKKNKPLYDKVVKALKEMEKDGTLPAIRKKWNFHL
jgi:ABC-type amino acid transport substrate-binding protein